MIDLFVFFFTFFHQPANPKSGNAFDSKQKRRWPERNNKNQDRLEKIVLLILMQKNDIEINVKKLLFYY